MNNPPDFSDKHIALETEFAAFPSDYELRVSGRISQQGAVWFEGMAISIDEKAQPVQTIIRGQLIDQAALYGLISRIRDLGLTLLSVKRLDEEEDIEAQALEGEAYNNIEDGQSAEDT